MTKGQDAGGAPALWRGYADVSIGQLHYLEDRDAGAREPLILLNPRSRSLLPMLPALARRFRVLVVDVPGFGGSSPPPAGSAMADVAWPLCQLMDQKGIAAAHVFGIHTGHKVAAALASEWPSRVLRLVLCGRTHSLIPERAARNDAMKRHVEEGHPDIAIIRFEGRFVDDAEQQKGFAAMFAANYAFDFAAACSRIASPTLVLEITSDREAQLYGAQGAALAGAMPHARVETIPETEPTGLDMYVGADRLTATLSRFLAEP